MNGSIQVDTHSNFPTARYALYYAPARASAWWSAGCAWLGRDPESGDELTPPQPAALTAPLTDLTATPRRYGWHATLIPPFRLAAGVTPPHLAEAAQAWAADQVGFMLPVSPAALGHFVALRPAHEPGAARTRELAARALKTLAGLRAPPSDDELERRLRARLSERQRALTQEWAYPFVLDEFRFHMTLSDPVAEADQTVLIAWWREATSRLGPLAIDGAAIFVEPAPGEDFRLWRRLPFGSGAAA
jgi:putative phosphonate metabolism protein